jgi:outer membrane protein assembly factor BamB
LKRQVIILFAMLGAVFVVQAQQNWTVTLPNIGTFSSPRVSDLNGDGIKDIILGAGRLEFQACDSAVIALNGSNGQLLWKVPARDQIFGSAALLDINSDGVEDVFINGRSSEFKALNGKTGKEIWSFDTTFYSNNHTKRWFNFYNAQFVSDLDNDGLSDILLANGGDIWVKPHDTNRAAGRLVLLSAATGKLLAEAIMPDNREIYMSAVVALDTANIRGSKIIFGTGGETTPGNLYMGTLGMVLDGSLVSATLLANGHKTGFIAPPAWVDISNDGILDIVANSVDGRLLAFDGQTFKTIWERKIPNTEAYSSMAIGNFTKDSIPDFFVSFAQGTWPDLSWTKQAMINGVTGNVEYADSLGYYQTSSPVVADLNSDGLDEVLLSVDYQQIDQLGRKSFFNTIYAFDFLNQEAIPLVEGLPGHNVSATPWIGDLDNDQMLDIVYSQGTNPYKTYTFDGLRITCLKTTIPIKKNVLWGSYMGSKYNGIYQPK